MSLQSHLRSLVHIVFLVCIPLPALFVGCTSNRTTPFEPARQGDLPEILHSSRALAPSHLPSNVGFYPLASGNRWHLSRVLTLHYSDLGGDTIRTSTDRVVIGTETRGDQRYFVQEETSTQDSRPGEVFRSWTRFRQDPTGLYHRYLCTCEPPTLDHRQFVPTAPSAAAYTERATAERHPVTSQTDIEGFDRSRVELHARIERMRNALSLSFQSRGEALSRPGGLGLEEAIVLAYPLRVGKTWQMLPATEYNSTVEGVDVLQTPAGRFPAYRIRVTPIGEAAGDFARVWYGRAGRLAHRIHVVIDGQDGWTADETEVVDELSISR